MPTHPWSTMNKKTLLLNGLITGGVLLAALCHELGHILAVKLTGGRVLAIRLRAGGARIETAPMSPGRTAFCALAGPAAGALTFFARNSFPELAEKIVCAKQDGKIDTFFYASTGGKYLAAVLSSL